MSAATMPEDNRPRVLRFSDHGVPFLARILLPGDTYGRGGCLVHDDPRPVLEFYDGRFSHSAYGQFVSRYRLDSLQDTRAGGLCLDGGNADVWYIGAENMRRVLAWAADTLAPVQAPGSLDAALPAPVQNFLRTLARMETETEINERTDGDGMSGDDACETLSMLIEQARALLKVQP